MNNQNELIDAKLIELGLTIDSVFVPASQRADEWQKTAVNFNVIVRKNGRVVYSGPYAYGVGNLPSYMSALATKRDGRAMVENAINTGRWPRRGHAHTGSIAFGLPAVPAPLLRDVIYSLIQDYSVIDNGSFESWASDYGYDTDSRKAEQTYRACLDSALQLRAALGDSVIAELQELFQDY
jgi:hypothetical protein